MSAIEPLDQSNHRVLPNKVGGSLRRGACLVLCVCLGLGVGSCGSGGEEGIDWSDETNWYSLGETSKGADIFYVYPTVVSELVEDGEPVWNARIDDERMRSGANSNQRFNKMLYSSCNFYAPYYRQMPLAAYSENQRTWDRALALAAEDVIGAFQHYWERFNQGRPFFLIGHSQGSRVLLELLERGMSDEQFERMVAAYCIGVALTGEEVRRHPDRLLPATDSTASHALVVFNSVTRPGVYSPILDGARIGVNPVNWEADRGCGDEVPLNGLAKYNEARDSVIIVPAQTRGRLQGAFMVCPDLPDDFCFIDEFGDLFPPGSLHFADSWLYGGDITRNIACRLRHFED